MKADTDCSLLFTRTAIADLAGVKPNDMPPYSPQTNANYGRSISSLVHMRGANHTSTVSRLPGVILANVLLTQHSEAIPAGGRFGIMERNPQPKAERDCSKKVKKMGRDVTIASAVMLFFGLVGYMQTMPHPLGELGHFMHDSSEVLLFFGPWGLATGIGLMWAWRWARISMLIFSAPLAVAGISCAVFILFHPVAPMPVWEHILFKLIFVSICAAPGAAGVALSVYFMRDNVKAYFRTSQHPKIPARASS
jgi:hypothetical protein